MNRQVDEAPLALRAVTPFGASTWLDRLSGSEGVSRLFEFEVDLVSDDASLDFTEIIGENMCVEIDLPNGVKRYVNGMVSRFAIVGNNVSEVSYRATVHPWLWLLTRRSDARIFQNKSTPEILEEVFGEYKAARFEKRLNGSYGQREFCVQYSETDFDFVSRLMEEEGIWYFFESSDTGHTMVLADAASAHQAVVGPSSVRVVGDTAYRESVDVVAGAAAEQEIVSSKFSHTDYDFLAPSTSMLQSVDGSGDAGERFEYPGFFPDRDTGARLATARLEALEAYGVVLEGKGYCRGFHAGGTFTLTEHQRGDLNREYLLVELSITAGAGRYTNSFRAIPSDVLPRPARLTQRPTIVGSQTAKVVGKSGEEIWTDSHGRVKLQFPWDRYGKDDENSSCWVRVSQAWAGNAYGAFTLPRIGQEVVVSFLEGNPDRPLVIGSVYNAEQPVPYTLPANQTRSLLKSDSSKGGGGSNELCFEDKKDAEVVYLHAQKDLDVAVENDHTAEVGNDSTITVTQNRSLTVSEGDASTTVAKGARTVTVSEGDETHEVGGTRSLTVTKDETHQNAAAFTHTVDGDFVLDVTGSVTIKAGKGIVIEAGTDFSAKAGTAFSTEAGTEMTHKASTKLTADGGMEILNKASVSATVQSDATVAIKSSGGMVNIEAGAMVGVKGAMVKLN